MWKQVFTCMLSKAIKIIFEGMESEKHHITKKIKINIEACTCQASSRPINQAFLYKNEIFYWVKTEGWLQILIKLFSLIKTHIGFEWWQIIQRQEMSL